MSGICLCEENCRGGTEVSVKITCDLEEKIMFGKALRSPCWKYDCTQNKKTKRRENEGEWRRGVIKVGGAIALSRENAHATGRRMLLLICISPI